VICLDAPKQFGALVSYNTFVPKCKAGRWHSKRHVPVVEVHFYVEEVSPRIRQNLK